MILIKKIKQVLIAGLVLILLVGINSCSKDNQNNPSPSLSKEERKAKILERIPEVINRLPQLAIIHADSKGDGKSNKDGGFSFSSGGDGFDFSNPSGNTYTSEEGVVVITTPGFGANAGGGVITAGAYTYDISATFCLSAGEEGDGSEIADVFTDGMDGVSLVIGVSGDLDFNSVDTNEAFGGLNALVLYVVFDDEASGNYEVINFFDIDEDTDDPFSLDGSAYAYIIDLENGKFFLSSDGTLQVNGGNISFGGEYLQLDFEGDDFFISEEPDDFKFVNGAGTLGC
ncbi:MAG: hypothetical protein RH860_02720 [Cytophagales bacterium]